MKCVFKQYGDSERVCKNCGYIIPSTDNDEAALIRTIESVHEIPSCDLNT
jgi:hypothetical protein